MKADKIHGSLMSMLSLPVMDMRGTVAAIAAKLTLDGYLAGGTMRDVLRSGAQVYAPLLCKIIT
jgi:hypothetical protein